jgi:hypothetical protein
MRKWQTIQKMKPISPMNSRYYVIIVTVTAITVVMIVLLLKYGFTIGPPIGDDTLRISVKTKQSRPSASSSNLQNTRALLNSKSGADATLSINDFLRLTRDNITPEQARVLLDRAKSEVKNINNLAVISSAILSTLCRHGYTTEAWELVSSNPGTVREAEIGSIFKENSGPVNPLLGKLETLVDPKERCAALVGLIGSRPTEIANLDFSKISMDSSQEKLGVAVAILAVINHESSTTSGDVSIAQSLLTKSMDLLKEGKLNVDNLVTILNDNDAKDAFHQWDLVDRLKDGISTKDLERLQAAVVQKMINSDADKSMDLICSSPSSKYSYPVLSRAINIMYSADPQSANTWVMTHLPSVDPTTGQHIIASVAQVAIKNGELNAARQWADQILNPEIKKQILGQIQAAQAPKPPAN